MVLQNHKLGHRMKLLEKPEKHPYTGKSGSYSTYLKRMKARLERHRANRDPECQPFYRKNKGWEW